MVKSEKKATKIIFIISLLIYSGLLFYLFYNQLLYGETGRFESDTFVHVRFAVEDHYFHSLCALFYVLFSFFPGSKILISIMLTAVTVLAIPATNRLIKVVLQKYSIELSKGYVYLISFVSNILSAFYLPFASRQHYIGYECANMWHNSTYLFMRLFAIYSLILFIKLYDSYKEKLTFKQWLSFSVVLMLTTGFKASFLTVFAPLMAVLLLVDLFKKTKFLKVFSFALTVLPSMAVMYLQSLILGGADSGNGYAISPFTALSLRGDHPKVTLILSVLFPLCVLFFCFSELKKNRIYFYSIVLWAVAFLEVFLLVETGERSLDGNFMWGYSIALFFVFIESIIVSVKRFLENRNKPIFVIEFIVSTLILLWHICSGVWYFSLLLTGVTYFV